MSSITGGTAIGIARHFGKQVPWETDADVAALLGTGDMTFDNRKNFMHHKLLPRLPGKWRIKVIQDKQTCLQYHLIKCFDTTDPKCLDDDVNYKSDAYPGAYSDLFFHRYVSDAPKAFIDGAWHRRISYGGCFNRDAPVPRAAAYHGLRATERFANGWGYYLYPPVRCSFYNTSVWCPRDIARYIKSYYGPYTLDRAVSHYGVYGNHYNINFNQKIGLHTSIHASLVQRLEGRKWSNKLALQAINCLGANRSKAT